MYIDRPSPYFFLLREEGCNLLLIIIGGLISGQQQDAHHFYSQFLELFNARLVINNSLNNIAEQEVIVSPCHLCMSCMHACVLFTELTGEQLIKNCIEGSRWATSRNLGWAEKQKE